MAKVLELQLQNPKHWVGQKASHKLLQKNQDKLFGQPNTMLTRAMPASGPVLRVGFHIPEVSSSTRAGQCGSRSLRPRPEHGMHACQAQHQAPGSTSMGRSFRHVELRPETSEALPAPTAASVGTPTHSLKAEPLPQRNELKVHLVCVQVLNAFLEAQLLSKSAYSEDILINKKEKKCFHDLMSPNN